jgi:hypothetical protein
LFGLGGAVGDGVEVRVYWCGDKVAERLNLATKQYNRVVMPQTVMK